VEWVVVDVGGRTIRLLRPAEPDRLLDDPRVHEENRRHDYMPYWAYLWPGAFLLAAAMGHRAWARGTPALELGCGLGLAGLAGVAAGLNVRFSDYDAAPLRFVEESARANGFSCEQFSISLLDWENPPDERYPVILGADLLYEPRHVRLVAGVLGRMLAPGGEALLAGPYRAAAEALPGELGRYGFRTL
jgi:predicted nicotinamide N-methyase